MTSRRAPTEGAGRTRSGAQSPAPRRDHHGRQWPLGEAARAAAGRRPRAGAEAVRRALQAAADNGVKVLTIYAFSSENWRRSTRRSPTSLGLMGFYLEREFDDPRQGGRPPQADRRLLGVRRRNWSRGSRGRSSGPPTTAPDARRRAQLRLACRDRRGRAQSWRSKAAAGEIDPAAIDEAAHGGASCRPPACRSSIC